MTKRLAALCAIALAASTALAQEGATVTVDVAKGGALGSLITAATWWLYNQRRGRVQISPDPLNVKGVPPSVKSPTCEAVHKGVDQRLDDNKADHANIFPRLAAVESRVATIEGIITEIRVTNKSIDEKLTVILRRMK